MNARITEYNKCSVHIPSLVLQKRKKKEGKSTKSTKNQHLEIRGGL